jgi:Kef-type K+ transport system membrane component KefB
VNTYQILILISSLIIFSYLFDLFSKKTRFPSILLLLASGVGIKYLCTEFNFPLIDFPQLLPVLGNLGLILIVLEGALELKYTRDKLSLVKTSLGAALFPMLLCIAAISALLFYCFQTDLHTVLLNSIPLAVISSAIAIPSAATLVEKKKEFIIYESSLSDILGIVIFNFVLINTSFTLFSFLELGIEIIIILIVSLVCCMGILFLLGKITHHIKYYLLFAVMILVYAVGKSFHLSSLIVILAVGIFLNNTRFLRFEWFRKYFIYKGLEDDLHQLIAFTRESAFLIRTFFFLIFGYSLNLIELMESEVFVLGISILLIIFSIRFVYLKWVAKMELLPEVFISPRGLISILLFYSIPKENWISDKENGIVLIVIIGTSIVMTIGLLTGNRSKNEALIENTSLKE